MKQPTMTHPVNFFPPQPSHQRRMAVTLGVLLWVALSLPVMVLAADAPPPQPTALTAQHRRGQTFLTWAERADLAGEGYRVYRHSAPIGPATIAAAQFLAQVGEGSATFYAARYKDYASPPTWAYRYTERLVVADGGPALAVDTGLLVWTLAPPDLAPADVAGAVGGAGYYAVTTVVDGVENLSDFGPGNTLGPLSETVALPQAAE